MTPTRALIEAAEQAYEALRTSYNVCDYPADGDTKQDHAMKSLRSAISSAKAAEEGVETAEEAWKRGYLAGALHVSDDLGATLYGIEIEEYSAPVREKEGL